MTEFLGHIKATPELSQLLDRIHENNSQGGLDQAMDTS